MSLNNQTYHHYFHEPNFYCGGGKKARESRSGCNRFPFHLLFLVSTIFVEKVSPSCFSGVFHTLFNSSYCVLTSFTQVASLIRHSIRLDGNKRARAEMLQITLLYSRETIAPTRL